ncbi:transposable element Tcb1 transposase [Trichonephila clavipes]|nr:transposable element Tcb1 transposase [Trichonephila clavipes]
MFTDKSRFALEPDDKSIRIWRKQKIRNQPQNITEHHAFLGGSIMVYRTPPGGTSHSLRNTALGYRTDLHIFKRGSVTAVRYQDEVLEPIVRLYAAAVDSTFVLMDDNARPHRADIVDDYLESEGIARMAWPAYSPDFNSIENLWDVIGRAVSSRFPPPATLIELETALKEEWRLFYSAVVDHLIESMIRWCKLCI